MLAKAIQEHNPASKFKAPILSRKATNALTPASTTTLNASRQFWPAKTNPLKRTASEANGREPATDRPDFKRSHNNLASMAQLGRVEKLHDTVYFDENDFEDDADIDLDADDAPLVKNAVPTALLYPPLPKADEVTYPPLPHPAKPARALPERPQSQSLSPSKSPSTIKHSPPMSSASIPWSSSPIRDNGPPIRAGLPAKPSQRRNLPWQTTECEESQALTTSTTSVVSKGPADRAAGQEKMGNSREERKFDQYAFTPLPKDNSRSPFPWNKTASALKEEQKRLRQGNKKLVRDNEVTDPSKRFTLAKRKGRVAQVYLSEEQKKIMNLVTEERKSVFFTGSAGTGKSVLLREIIKNLRIKHQTQPDRVAVTASTGLAACNINGVTLHSFAGIGLGKEDVPELVKKVKRNQKAKSRWLRTKILIIDEISMVDGDLFDKLENIARIIRNNGRPFGGIQLVITGDFFQLPPVPDYGKVAKFSFDAATWNTSIEHTIGLTQVFRQKDPAFANMLNEMRLGRLSAESIDTFRSLNRPLAFDDDFEATELFSTRQEVDNANNNRMRILDGRSWDFRAIDGGTIVDVTQRDKLLSNCMAPPLITLKKGAQVMLIKNMDETLVNGSIGKVVAFMDEKTFDIYRENEDDFQSVGQTDPNDDETTQSRKKLKAMINKDLAGDTSRKWPLVRFSIADGSSRDLLCQPEAWKIELPNGEIQASRSQIPLILAWALSIHKAQGQTLERVKVDLGKIFEKGQAYVALSRATSQEGLQVLRFDPKKVMAHDKVRTFYDSLYSINDTFTIPTTSAVKKTGGMKSGQQGFEGDHEWDEDALFEMLNEGVQ